MHTACVATDFFVDITAVQQDILRKVYETDDISTIPQVWAMYKEVMGYFADGMNVPDNGTSKDTEMEVDLV